MGVRELLDRNPIIALVTASVAVGSVVAAITAYFADQKISAMEEKEKATISQLSTKHTAELSEVSNSLKGKIDELSSKLASIKRNIPGTGPAYIDISRIVIGREFIQTLPSSYRKYWDGDFYLNAPHLENWSFSETNELEVYRLIYSQKIVDTFAQGITKIFANSGVIMWRSNNHTSIKTKTRAMREELELEELTLSYYPMVYIQKFGKSDISERAAALFEFLSDADQSKDDADRSMDKIGDRISKIDNDISSMKADAGGQAPQTPPKKGEGDGNAASSGGALSTVVSDAAKSKELAEEKEKLVEELSSIYSVDLASFVMGDYFVRAMHQAHMFGCNFRVFSAQKKGNVIYLQAQQTFTIPDVDSKKGSSSHIDVNEEIFYFSMGESGLLVTIILPDIEGRAEDAAWIRSWLAGLQIPLKQ